jgi:hypothetical protein
VRSLVKLYSTSRFRIDHSDCRIHRIVLAWNASPVTLPVMKLLLVYFTWFAMAGILATGIVMAVNGSIWLLALGLLGFILAFAKLGCLPGH